MCTGIYAYFFMPETTGLTLKEIQDMYAGTSSKKEATENEDITNISSAPNTNVPKTFKDSGEQTNFPEIMNGMDNGSHLRDHEIPHKAHMGQRRRF